MSENDTIRYSALDNNDTSDTAARTAHVFDKAPPLLSPKNVQEPEARLRNAHDLVALVQLPTNTWPN